MKLDIYEAGLVSENRGAQERKIKGNQMPCLLCGRGVGDGFKAKWFWLHGGGGILITTKQDAEDLGGGAADLGAYPVGPDCYRRHKTILKPFVMATIIE